MFCTNQITFPDVVIQQANWDSSKVREKLQRDIDAHVAAVRAASYLNLPTYMRYFFKFRVSTCEEICRSKIIWATCSLNQLGKYRAYDLEIRFNFFTRRGFYQTWNYIAIMWSLSQVAYYYD